MYTKTILFPFIFSYCYSMQEQINHIDNLPLETRYKIVLFSLSNGKTLETEDRRKKVDDILLSLTPKKERREKRYQLSKQRKVENFKQLKYSFAMLSLINKQWHIHLSNPYIIEKIIDNFQIKSRLSAVKIAASLGTPAREYLQKNLCANAHKRYKAQQLLLKAEQVIGTHTTATNTTQAITIVRQAKHQKKLFQNAQDAARAKNILEEVLSSAGKTS